MEEEELFPDDIVEDDFFYSYDMEDEEDDNDMFTEKENNLLVMEYVPLFEPPKNPGGEIINLQKMQTFKEMVKAYENVLILCHGNIDVEHFLYVYRTIDAKNKAICFFGEQDDFLLKRVTFELQTQKEQVITLKKPDKQEYLLMLQQFLNENGYSSEKLAPLLLRSLLNYRKDFFTEQDIYDYVGRVIKRHQKQDAGELNLSDFEFAYSGKREEAAVEKLEKLIGLSGVKEQVKRAVVSQIISENSEIPSYGHMSFSGRPGTAKTTCARLYNDILTELDLSNGRFIEVGRADIIGTYLGETASKVKNLFEQADGGMIFIDEAGFLQKTEEQGDIYVREAVTELVRNLENNPQTRVIFATYPEYAKEVLEADPGLSSRLKVLSFPSYSEQELLQILFKMTEDRNAVIEDSQKEAVSEVVLSYVEPRMGEKNFGNGRELRKILETALEEYGLELFMADQTGFALSLQDKKKKMILTAEHFKKAVYHIKNSSESLESRVQRKIGFVLPA